MAERNEHIPYVALVAVVAIVGVVVLLQQSGNSSFIAEESKIVGSAVRTEGMSCVMDTDCDAGEICDWNVTAVRSYVQSPSPADKRCVVKSSLGESCASRTVGGSLQPIPLADWECESGLICVRSPGYANPTCQNARTLAIGNDCVRDEQCRSGLCTQSSTGTMVCS